MAEVETPQSNCRFAIARADITPPVGMYHRMWGAATHDRSIGVHRPLNASVMMFAGANGGDSADQNQILVALDHCLMGREEIDLLLDAIEDATSEKRSSVVITFSHTHAAGLMLLDRQTEPGGEMIPDYLNQLGATLAGLVADCRKSMQTAAIVYGHGRCSLAAHRDFREAENDRYVIGFNPYQDGDQTLLVARMTASDGRLLATMVNYACHPTTLAWGNQLISPDFPGAMREIVEQATGVPCVFVQGASGELGPREGFVADVEVADRNGRQLGYAALSVIESMPPAGTLYRYDGAVVSGATIGTWNYKPIGDERRVSTGAWQSARTAIDLPYLPDLPSIAKAESDLASARADATNAQSAGDDARAQDCRALVERQARLLCRLRGLPQGGTFPYRAVAWRMGDAIWLSVQAEPYSVLQTQLRQRFAGTPIVVVSMSDDWGPAYLPPRDLYGKGIYQESIAVLAPGCLERLIAELTGIIERIQQND